MNKLHIPKFHIFEPFFWIYYIWYYLPIVRSTFSSNIHKIIMFSFLLIGFFLLIIEAIIYKRNIVIKFNVLVPVLCFIVIFFFMYILGLGNASEHIKVSFTFWGTLLVFYSMSLFENARERLTKLFFIMFLFTALTSLLGVLSDPRAARLLTYSANAIEEDIALKKLNIGNMYFFQSLILFVPVILNSKKKPFIIVFFLVIIFISLVKSSFTTSIILFFVALIYSKYSNTKDRNKFFIMLFMIPVLFMIPWNYIFQLLIDIIPNEMITKRLLAIVKLFEVGLSYSGLSSRFKLWATSLSTFISNPFGIGPIYTYVAFENGIGYHSQILDDLARYGILALLFYIVFFYQYNKLLSNQWEKIDMKHVGTTITVLYFFLLLLNPGFTSAYESVVMLFLLPMFPEILNKRVRS